MRVFFFRGGGQQAVPKRGDYSHGNGHRTRLQANPKPLRADCIGGHSSSSLSSSPLSSSSRSSSSSSCRTTQANWANFVRGDARGDTDPPSPQASHQRDAWPGQVPVQAGASGLPGRFYIAAPGRPGCPCTAGLLLLLLALSMAGRTRPFSSYPNTGVVLVSIRSPGQVTSLRNGLQCVNIGCR